ncbi:MAG: 23S rRNA (pseudouridine(1915)-N(3))-methyltransferase RlmH [Acidobacteriota bacterium]|nr:23S rRNA (pseudouridine(1915)-N(3))-methyltransferase RlmH [Blastocatellia bacterium]MDW8412575.1 23S rRNA (pseudouridine(1915)-N(3))-methyltransferase RlmH [Acidobacteriota bacterium]
MKFYFVWIGKTRNPHLEALVEEYLRRLGRYARYELRELKDARNEDQTILSALERDIYTIVLDELGEQWTSRELASALEKWQLQSIKGLAFVVGGAEGLGKQVKARANRLWSLSKLTFTHEMVRVLLLEQLYRACTIIHGHPYQK